MSRVIGGVLLILLGVAIIAGIGFVLFVTPFLGGGWDTAEYFAGLIWIPAAVGLVAIVGGTGLVRSRRRNPSAPTTPLTSSSQETS